MANVGAADAKAWLTKARHDLEAARRVGGANPPLLDVALYHCQQAAENALKAFLLFRQVRLERTHDIGVLVEMAAEADPDFGDLQMGLRP
jgi:HEPN domain-containing protein